MPEQVKVPGVQRRKNETTGSFRKRGKQVGAAQSATEDADKEKQHAPWRAMWEKESGKKYGIATAGEYNSWLSKKRDELEKKKASGQTAKKQGSALRPGGTR